MTDTPAPVPPRTALEARETLRHVFGKGDWWPLMELAWSEAGGTGATADKQPPPGYHFTESSDRVAVKDTPAPVTPRTDTARHWLAEMEYNREPSDAIEATREMLILVEREAAAPATEALTPETLGAAMYALPRSLSEYPTYEDAARDILAALVPPEPNSTRPDNGLDVTDREAVLVRLHNDATARYFYELGKGGAPDSGLNVERLAEAIVATISEMADGVNGLLDHAPIEVAHRIVARLSSADPIESSE